MSEPRDTSARAGGPTGLGGRRTEGRSGLAARGQVLALVAVMIVALLALAAMVIDTGRIWMARRALQNSVDAAALAGARELPDDAGLAMTVACDYGTVRNYVSQMAGSNCGGMATVTISAANFGGVNVPNGQITVHATRPIVPSLSGLLPWPTVTVGADATVVIGSLHTVCVFPLFQTVDRLQASGAWVPDGNGNFVEFNTPVVMKTNSTGSNQGNFLYLQANGSSSKDDIRDAIGSPGGCAQQTTNTGETAPGNAVGPLDQGMATRATHWNNPGSPGYCPNSTPTFNADGIAVHPAGHPLAGQPITPENCYRLVQIPMLTGVATDYHGQSSGALEGYLSFYISNWCGQTSTPKKGTPDSQHCAAPAGTSLPPLGWGELWGYYLMFEAVTDNPINPYDGLGTKVLVLID